MSPEDTAEFEAVIRDLAAVTVSDVNDVLYHPSYGATKGRARFAYARLEGAIGAYMVLTDQVNNPGLPHLAVFTEDRTTSRVEDARLAILSIKPR